MKNCIFRASLLTNLSLENHLESGGVQPNYVGQYKDLSQIGNTGCVDVLEHIWNCYDLRDVLMCNMHQLYIAEPWE
jgi:hypothetical protein